jgi:glycosyltransferase involved in cell wall biosynthesis
MLILVLTRYQRLGSSSRVRFYQYFPFLESQGIHIINAPFFDDEYICSLYSGRRISRHAVLKAYIDRIITLTQKKNIELVWVEKEFLPWFPFEIESFFRPSKIPYVVDYDDAVFHRYDAHPNPLVRRFLGHKIDHVMGNASLVIAGNDYIAERADKSGALRIEILPSVVDVSRYTVRQPDDNMVFKIGWIGAPVTAKYLEIVHEALFKLKQETPIQLVLVGAGKTPPFPDIPTELISWNEELELAVNQRFDVGIMPLIDDLFERGKCGYKLIQYMAGGIPVIASPVGVNQKIVEPGVNGYLANSLSEWLTSLRKLRDNPKMRIEMGNAGRQKAESLYNLQVTAPKLLELLKSATR